MKVKDIIYAAAQALGFKEGVEGYFERGEEALKREAELLLACFHHTESSLALEYLPLYAEDELLAVTGRLEFSAFTYAPVRILGVEDGEGNPVKYKLYPQYIKAQSGLCKVTYTYTPNKKGIDEESDFTLLTAESMLMHGVLAEYCTAEGRFEEASVWEKKYKEGIEAAFRGRVCKRLSSRRWM